jgi:hypothetical protein
MDEEITSVIISQRKACDCYRATASSGKIRFEQSRVEGDQVRVTVTFCPWNSCDECGKPWEIFVTQLHDDERKSDGKET